MSTTALPSVPSELLTRPSGGVTMRLTQYGYPGDPYSDSETRKGHGAYHTLAAGESVALTDSGLSALGLSRSQVRSEHPFNIAFHDIVAGGMKSTDAVEKAYKRIEEIFPKFEIKA